MNFTALLLDDYLVQNAQQILHIHYLAFFQHNLEIRPVYAGDVANLFSQLQEWQNIVESQAGLDFLAELGSRGFLTN